jgi:hypothetical protein
MRDDRNRAENAGWQVDLGSYGAESTEMDVPKSDGFEPEGPFTVEVKPSARERNVAADRLATERGAIHEYLSRADAVARAELLSEDGDVRVAIQGVAPQDDTPADAYLVAQPRRHVRTPREPDDRPWTFDTSGNQYGAIAETVLTTPRTNPPALTYFVREDLDVEDEVRVVIETGRSTNHEIDDDGRRTATWEADVVATAHRASTGAPLREYWCEIKAGDASFERDQTAVMRAKAADSDVTVVTIRVDLDPLPDRYGVRFDPVAPETDPS